MLRKLYGLISLVAWLQGVGIMVEGEKQQQQQQQ
jgi:hypothetical protein